MLNDTCGLNEPVTEIICDGGCKRSSRLTNTCCHALLPIVIQRKSIRHQSLSSFPEHFFLPWDVPHSLPCGCCWLSALPFLCPNLLAGIDAQVWVYDCDLPFSDTCLRCLITEWKSLICVKIIVSAGGRNILRSRASLMPQTSYHVGLSPPSLLPLAANLQPPPMGRRHSCRTFEHIL